MRCRLALATDLPAVTDALARAFVDDPMIRWVVGTDDPAEVVRCGAGGFFAPATRAGLRRGHTYLVADDGAVLGAAVWSPPDVDMFDDAAIEDLLDALGGLVGPEALERLGALGELTGARHPHDRAHFYLLALGATERGRGAGAAAMAPVLDRCDADGLPAYLESSNPRNLGFYGRLGFEPTWEAALPDGGPLLTGMWREPRG